MERIRSLFETREQLEVTATNHILQDSKSQEKRVQNQHAAAAALDAHVAASRQLSEALAAPIGQDVGRGVAGEAFSVFYDRLRAIKDYHMRFPYLPVPQPSLEPKELPQIPFSGTERHGRHLDLHEFYDSYVNLSHMKARREREPNFSFSYREYVGSFFEFDANQTGKDADYLHYLQDLTAYLIDFLKRSQPLLDTAHLIRSIDTESAAQWDDGSFRSWGAGDEAGADSLYCVACATSFAKKGTYDGHLKGKKHLNNVKKDTGEALRKQIFLLEVKVNRLSDSLAEVVQATIADIEKKQSRTLREQLDAMNAESDDSMDEEDEEKEEEDEEQGFVRQIKNYPIGWDGEPIPYWLYRLHGLGVEYKCEICGNTSYWGRRAFEKHFEEFRHQSGMKLLGLPNTAHFFEIVRIKDAIELNKKLEAEKNKGWKPEEQVEMEDDQGRVYDRKTFELLRKQGVIKEKKT